MCGRYTNALTWRQIVELYGITAPGPDAAPNLPPRYNIAPTQSAPVVRPLPGGGRELVSLRWGLAPFWMRELKGPPLINARAESVEDKPAFRDAFDKRRCLVPADGIYEWVGPPKGRLPYRIIMADGSPMTFAGLWDSNGTLGLESFTILTTAGNVDMQAVHDRMPVILQPADFARWLDPAQPAADLLAPAPAETLRLFRVDPRVNSYKVDDAGCIDPLVA
jgi:putative SOS response-associated peptidase YedK